MGEAGERSGGEENEITHEYVIVCTRELDKNVSQSCQCQCVQAFCVWGFRKYDTGRKNLKDFQNLSFGVLKFRDSPLSSLEEVPIPHLAIASDSIRRRCKRGPLVSQIHHRD